jgi:hypothetical protein
MVCVATDWGAPASARKRRGGVLRAALWALAGAVCAGGVWPLAVVVVYPLFGVSFQLSNSDVFTNVLLGAALGGLYGILAGAVVVGFRRANERLALVAGGGFFGALGCVLAVLAVAATAPEMHPLVSSSLAWAVVGALACATGYVCARRIVETEPIADLEDEDEDTVPPKRIEWLLREVKRRVLNRSMRAVLPVLIASVGALVAAALVAPSEVWLALFAVGVLGLAVALVLYRQEERLRALERRLPGARDRRA